MSASTGLRCNREERSMEARNIKPYLDMLAGLKLPPPREPGDPENINRAEEVIEAVAEMIAASRKGEHDQEEDRAPGNNQRG